MSINVQYPSEYFKEAITAKGVIKVKTDLTADKDGVTPLDYLISNNNQTELKRIVAERPNEVSEIIGNSDVLSLCESVAIFKLLHNCYHSVKKDYEISHFEDAIAIASGATLYQYAHRVKSDDKIGGNVKKQLTTVGLRNFINSITWTPKKSLRSEKLTPASESFIYMTDFISRYYDSSAYFEVSEDGSTPLHELVKSDNLGRFLYVIKAFSLTDLEKCIDGFGNTLLNAAIQSNSKKIVEYLITTEGFSINDSYNDDNLNSACNLFAESSKFSEKNLRAQHYVDMIDESKLKKASFSILNHSRNTKLDLSKIIPMKDELLNISTSKKGENYHMLIKANAEMIAAAEAKARAALEKAEAAVKR